MQDIRMDDNGKKKYLAAYSLHTDVKVCKLCPLTIQNDSTTMTLRKFSR